MFPMSPEDKLREVIDYQDGQRRQMARERMVRAATPRHPFWAVRLPKITGPRWHDPWLAVRHALRSLTATRRASRSRAR